MFTLCPVLQAAPQATANGTAGKDTAIAAVEQLKQEATPSHDIYGHLPKPEENDKVNGMLLGQGTTPWTYDRVASSTSAQHPVLLHVLFASSTQA